MPVRATKRGAARHPFLPGADADVLICGASFAGLAVARELARDRRAGARARPLRDRRAPDLGLRGAHRVAAQPRAGGVDPADVRLAARAHAGRRAGALGAAVDVLHVRLPAAVRAACGSRAATRSSRPPRSRDAPGSVVHTDRGDVARAACRRRARLAPRARHGRERAAAGRRAVARAGGPSARARRRTSSCGSTRATSTPATAGRSPRATSCGSASARSTRATRSSSPTLRLVEDVAAAARTATRATGSRTGCGRRPRTACSSPATAPATACR